MTNKIEILSLGSACRKTENIIGLIKFFLEKHNVEYELNIITDPNLIINYNTLIFPTVLINDKIVSRGYKPNNETILEALYENINFMHGQ